MNVFEHSDQPRTAPRTLRRLGHSPAVATTYASRRPALETIEEESAAAVRRGYENGFAEGLAKASREAEERREEASRRTLSALAVLSQAVTAIQEADLRMRGDIQAAAPKLAFALLETLLGREVQLAMDPGRDAIARVLALDEGKASATVRLNPADIDALDGVDLGRVVNVVADPAVEPGGALAEIGKGTLDGQLGPALDRVRKVLLGPANSGTDDDRAA